MISTSELVDLGRVLRALAEMPVTTGEQLVAWDQKAWALQERLKANPDLADAVPHHLWHYLSDADIRLKDPRYREMQQAEVKLIIEAFERGSLPDLGPARTIRLG